MSHFEKVDREPCRYCRWISADIIVDDQAANRTIYAKIASSIADDVWTRTFGDPREALEARADREQAEIFAPAARPLSILVAEDNRTNQMVIVKTLERVGHSATVVKDGEAALDALEENHFDLVLMDLNMPVMNGIEATKQYRRATRAHRGPHRRCNHRCVGSL
jgi:PleD family two-component response regulator